MGDDNQAGIARRRRTRARRLLVIAALAGSLWAAPGAGADYDACAGGMCFDIELDVICAATGGVYCPLSSVSLPDPGANS